MPFRFGGDAVHVYLTINTTNRLLKKGLIYRNHYTSLEQLRSDLNDYVWWSDNQRLHSTLGYRSPKEFTEQGLVL